MTLNKVFEIMSSLALKSNVSPAVPDAVYEWANSYKPPEPAVQTEQDEIVQNDAKSVVDKTPSKSSVKVKKFRTKQEVLQKKYLGVTMSKPPQEAPAMTATTNNAQIKQDAENLKEQNKAIQVNAPQVMTDNSSTHNTTNVSTAPPARALGNGDTRFLGTVN